jgi:hypothetical protein
MPRKNPHAVSLGRRGGLANTEAQQAARRRNGLKGGQPPRYRLVQGAIERREGDRWLTLEEPFDRATKEAMRRLQRHS